MILCFPSPNRQFPTLLILSTLWAGFWARQLAIPSFIFAVLVCLLSSNIFLRLKRGYPLTAESDVHEHGESDVFYMWLGNVMLTDEMLVVFN